MAIDPSETKLSEWQRQRLAKRLAEKANETGKAWSELFNFMLESVA